MKNPNPSPRPARRISLTKPLLAVAAAALVTGFAQAVDPMPSKGPAAPAAAAPGRTQRLDRLDQVPDGLNPSDWASIRAAYEAGRHQVVATKGAWQARNPGQHWGTRFDGRGFLVQPEDGHWQWGLELQAYGFPGWEHRVAQPPQVNAQGQRVVYDWDDTLQEWFRNDARGLEHGFTVRQRPSLGPPRTPREPSELIFTLGVRGGLRPEVQADGRGVRFVDSQGAAALTYNSLEVLDASGRKLPACFEPLAGGSGGCHGLRLIIDESSARYPIRIDPLVQRAYLKASNTDAHPAFPGEEFGTSVAISGDTVVVGAPGERSNATGVNGDQSDNSAPHAGAAYVFVRSGGVWSQQAYLKASNTDSGDRFGSSVAISGDTVVVGAYDESSSATGVNGDQSDNSLFSAGAAYVFVRSGDVWSQQAYLKASNTDADDSFGDSVAISGDTVVVGAHAEGSKATGVNGDQSDNSSLVAGAAYVFVRSSGVWSQQAYLKASNTDPHPAFGSPGDSFGGSVAISGDTVVVGAPLEDSKATGVNGDQSDNSLRYAGAAYVFVRSSGVWSQQAYLKASNTDAADAFGSSVAISGDTVVVGAGGEGSKATGVNGDQSDNSLYEPGAAYVFVRSSGAWSQQAYLKASNTDAADAFGSSVAISGDTVVVGARWESSSATGVNGDQSDNSAAAAGAAYVFVRSSGVWSQQVYLKASNTDADDQFGGSVAISGDTVVVGAAGEDSNATGVNGDQSDNSAEDAGAAYVFELNNPPIAVCQNVVKSADASCQATVTPGEVDNGSSDPDGDPITLSLNPPGPYPLGSNTVTLVVTDSHGATNSCTATVVVQDTTPPTINCPSNIVQSTDPGQCSAVVSYTVTASDNCSGGAGVNVNVYSGHSISGGGTPYSGLAGSFAANGVTFATDTGFNWHPFGLGDFGADITGCLNVAADDIYSFSLNSDDGSLLYIDGNLVVDNGGPHSPAVASGSALLLAGLHSFEVQFFEDFGGTSGVDLGLPTGVTYASCGIAATCNPPSGSTFPKGTNTVVCCAADAAGNTNCCSFTVTVQDKEAPLAACRPAVNPSDKKIPTAGKNPKSGQNPDGFYQLLGNDNCDPNPTCYVQDSITGFLFGPFANGDIVKIVQSKHDTMKPTPPPVVAQIQLVGDALVYAVDADGNVGAAVSCLVPKPPK